jgi:hypothetical protein
MLSFALKTVLASKKFTRENCEKNNTFLTKKFKLEFGFSQCELKNLIFNSVGYYNVGMIWLARKMSIFTALVNGVFKHVFSEGVIIFP